MVDGDGVIRIEDETVFRPEVSCDSELGLHIVFHFITISVEMVRSDVGYNRNIRVELITVVQLETADFQYIIVEVLGRYLISVTLSDIAA